MGGKLKPPLLPACSGSRLDLGLAKALSQPAPNFATEPGNAARAMRAVSSGTGGTGCGRRSDMGDLWTRKASKAMAPHTAADFANGVRSIPDSHSHVVSFPVWLERLSRFAEVLHRADVNALGCRGHIAQGHVVEHALAQGRDLFGHGELPSSGLQDRQS